MPEGATPVLKLLKNGSTYYLIWSRRGKIYIFRGVLSWPDANQMQVMLRYNKYGGLRPPEYDVLAKAWRKLTALCQFMPLSVGSAVLILNAMALMSENPVTSKKKSPGGMMRGRQSPDLKWKSESANDNSPSRTVAGEGVVQCLHFLARELDHLAFPDSAAEVLTAAVTLQARIDASRSSPAASPLGNTSADRTVAVSAVAPTA